IFAPWYANAWIIVPSGVAGFGLVVWAFVARSLYAAKRREAERLREQMLEQEHKAREGLEREISERKRVWEKQRISEARLQAIIDNSPAVIFLKDAQGRYLLANRRFEALFHVTKEQVSGMTDYDLWPKEMADAYWAHDRAVLDSRRAIEFEERAPSGDEFRTYISIKFPL